MKLDVKIALTICKVPKLFKKLAINFVLCFEKQKRL